MDRFGCHCRKAAKLFFEKLVKIVPWAPFWISPLYILYVICFSALLLTVEYCWLLLTNICENSNKTLPFKSKKKNTFYFNLILRIELYQFFGTEDSEYITYVQKTKQMKNIHEFQANHPRPELKFFETLNLAYSIYYVFNSVTTPVTIKSSDSIIHNSIHGLMCDETYVSYIFNPRMLFVYIIGINCFFFEKYFWHIFWSTNSFCPDFFCVWIMSHQTILDRSNSNYFTNSTRSSVIIDPPPSREKHFSCFHETEGGGL